MKIVFSPHAIMKMAQRRIYRSLAREVVASADFIRPSYGLREERYKKFGRNYLKAVVKTEDGKVTVITVHWVGLQNKREVILFIRP